MYQKSEDKDSNTAGTVGAHVEDTPPTEESIAPSGEASIGALFWKPALNSCLFHATCSVEKI